MTHEDFMDEINNAINTMQLTILSNNPSWTEFYSYCNQNAGKQKREVYYEDWEKSKKTRTREDFQENLCPICMVNDITNNFPCGHGVCNKCSLKITICPLCRKDLGPYNNDELGSIEANFQNYYSRRNKVVDINTIFNNFVRENHYPLERIERTISPMSIEEWYNELVSVL